MIRMRGHRSCQVPHIERVQVIVLVRLHASSVLAFSYHREVHRLARVPRDVVRIHAHLHLAQNGRRADLRLNPHVKRNVVEENASLAGRGCEQSRFGRIKLRL